jgi:hypothetical protein
MSRTNNAQISMNFPAHAELSSYSDQTCLDQQSHPMPIQDHAKQTHYKLCPAQVQSAHIQPRIKTYPVHEMEIRLQSTTHVYPPK